MDDVQLHFFGSICDEDERFRCWFLGIGIAHVSMIVGVQGKEV
jgi:hypothetical protein